MLKTLVLFIFTIVLMAECTNNKKTTKTALSNNIKKSNVLKQIITTLPLTDSAELIKHLDSLPKVTFPLETSAYPGVPPIDLSKFKKKKLFSLFYKRNPRIIGGAGIDDDDRRDSTFSLCDTSYKASWILVAKTPKFFVVEVNTDYVLLVTIDYHLKVINAIHVAASDPTGNNHFQGELESTIYKNFKIVMHYTYNVQTDAEGHFDTINEDDIWRINKKGLFKPVLLTKPDEGN